MEEKAFAKLIKNISREAKVLDIGSGGLEGENTTRALLDHFGAENVTGICKDEKMVEVFRAQLKEERKAVPSIEVVDYYDFQTDEKFDLVVHDLNIDNNLKDWSVDGLERSGSFLKDGGFLIQYVMTTEHYGDPEETPALLRAHRNKFWWTSEFSQEMIGNRLRHLKNWEIWACEREQRRPYITWVMLRKV